MKKVLAIAPYPYLPFFSGGQKFIAGFFAHLAEQCELTVITVSGTDKSLAENYRILPLLKPGFSRYMDLSLVRKISNEIKSGTYETVIWEHPYYTWLAVKVRQQTGVPFIIHTHNIEYQRFRSTGRWWWPILKVYEKWAFRKADHIFFIIPEDREFAITKWNIDPSKCSELPFGVETSEYPANKQEARLKLCTLHGIDPDAKIILFNGLLNYKPNLDALRFILGKINPLLSTNSNVHYKIIICGKGLPAEMNNLEAYRSANVIYAGFVEDIEMYFLGADLLLNPVQSGGGIKTKMVEAIAYGTTVVAGRTGATGIHREVCGTKLHVVDDNDPEAFVNGIEAVNSSEEKTPAAFYDFYYWKNIIKRIVPKLTDKFA